LKNFLTCATTDDMAVMLPHYFEVAVCMSAHVVSGNRVSHACEPITSNVTSFNWVGT